MFKDYYAILEIEETVSIDEIRAAFKKMALKYHPDQNPGVDTNDKMREVIEAHQILKDEEARKRYDKEYRKYKAFKSQSTINTYSENKADDKAEHEYVVTDDTLLRWMRNAKEQANDLLEQVIADFRETIKSGKDGCIANIMMYIPWILGFIFGPLLLRMCSA